MSLSQNDAWWFGSMLLVLLIFIGMGFIQLRSYKSVKSRSTLEKTVDERILRLNTLLNEKNVLLRELHHRVKNNLQVISGLFEMRLNKTENEVIRTELSQSRNQLRTMALIQEQFYQLGILSFIEFNHFVSCLCSQVSELFQKERQPIKIINEVPYTEMDIDTAMPLGLILNELLTNSYKYAFNNTTEGIIVIKLQKVLEGKFKLIYSDNGPGIAPEFDHSVVNSLGIQLIHDLSRQIGGFVQYLLAEESTFIITFTNKAFKQNLD